MIQQELNIRERLLTADIDILWRRIYETDLFQRSW